jgi:hypothetical protein
MSEDGANLISISDAAARTLGTRSAQKHFNSGIAEPEEQAIGLVSFDSAAISFTSPI